MTDNQTDDSQRDTEQLKAELADKEREIEELKREKARTIKVGDDLWTHEIYIRARKKLAAGVIVILGALSALGLVTVYQLYQSGVEYVDGEMREQIADRINKKADDMVEAAGEKMDRQISEHLKVLIEEMKIKIGAQIAVMQQEVEATLATSAAQATARMTEVVEKKKAEIGSQIAALQQEVDVKLATSAAQATGRMTSLVEEKKTEIEVQVAATQQEIEATLASSVSQATARVTAQVEAAEQEIKIKIRELEKTIQDEGDDLSKRIQQYRVALQTTGEATRVDSEITQVSIGCDSTNLTKDQIELVAIRQYSDRTGQKFNGREIFRNTFSLDVRTTNEMTSAAVKSCILGGVDRVVYGADPKWYSPSEFVRIDREKEFRFAISGWGPTELSAQIYFIGQRDPRRIQGNLTMMKVTHPNKRYLGEVPPD